MKPNKQELEKIKSLAYAAKREFENLIEDVSKNQLNEFVVAKQLGLTRAFQNEIENILFGNQS